MTITLNIPNKQLFNSKLHLEYILAEKAYRDK